MSLDIEPSGRLRPGYRVRRAVEADARAVRELDDLAFPPDSTDQQRAADGELEATIGLRDLVLLERGDELVAYLEADTSQPGQLYFPGLAVRPSLQGQGLGSMLIDECLASLRHALGPGLSIVTVTSPRNERMLRILFAHRFAARWVLRDYFGPECHRLGLNLCATPAWSTPVLGHIPAARVDDLLDAIDAGLIARALVGRGRAAHFEVAEPTPEDFPAHAEPPSPAVIARGPEWSRSTP